MANLNKVFLMGNLTRDPELRSTQGGTNVCKFGMAINRRWKGQGDQQQESTCYVDLTAFGRQAEVLNQYCKKGKPLFVEGRLEFSSWQTQDGQKRNKLEVIVENFQFLGAPAGRAAGGEASDAGGGFGNAGFGEEAESEIPF